MTFIDDALLSDFRAAACAGALAWKRMIMHCVAAADRAGVVPASSVESTG
jgi:hypothetical protein